MGWKDWAPLVVAVVGAVCTWQFARLRARADRLTEAYANWAGAVESMLIQQFQLWWTKLDANSPGTPRAEMRKHDEEMARFVSDTVARVHAAESRLLMLEDEEDFRRELERLSDAPQMPPSDMDLHLKAAAVMDDRRRDLKALLANVRNRSATGLV